MRFNSGRRKTKYEYYGRSSKYNNKGVKNYKNDNDNEVEKEKRINDAVNNKDDNYSYTEI